MAEPARPFIGAVLTEIAKLDGGIPAAAAELQISPKAINALANGGELSADELAAIHGNASHSTPRRTRITRNRW